MRNFALIIFPLFLISCQKKQTEVPGYALDKESFSDLLVDFSLSEAATSLNVLNVPPQKADTVYAFNPLLDHQISRKKFDTTLYFYSRNPKLFKEVYELTLEKLSRLQSERK